MVGKYSTLLRHVGHHLVCEHEDGENIILCEDCLELLALDTDYHNLEHHIGHDIACVTYGCINVSIECETCNEVLYSVNTDNDYSDETITYIDDEDVDEVGVEHVDTSQCTLI